MVFRCCYCSLKDLEANTKINTELSLRTVTTYSTNEDNIGKFQKCAQFMDFRTIYYSSFSFWVTWAKKIEKPKYSTANKTSHSLWGFSWSNFTMWSLFIQFVLIEKFCTKNLQDFDVVVSDVITDEFFESCHDNITLLNIGINFSCIHQWWIHEQKSD